MFGPGRAASPNPGGAGISADGADTGSTEPWAPGAFWYEAAQRQRTSAAASVATTMAQQSAQAAHSSSNKVTGAVREQFNKALLSKQIFRNPHTLETLGTYWKKPMQLCSLKLMKT